MSASILVALLLVELALRVGDYHYHPLRIDPNQHPELGADWRQYHALRDEHFVYDPYLIWRPKAGFDVFNRQGFRGTELTPGKLAGSCRIFAIGDSNTLGWGNDGPNWPAYLEQLFQAGPPRCTVTNAGVWGYSSFQGLRRFKEILPLRPDLVLISFGSNDALKVAVSDATYARRMSFGGLLGRSRTGELLLSFWDRLFLLEAQPSTPRVSLREYADNLREIIRLARERNFVVVLLTRPLIDAGPIGHFRRDARAYGVATLALGRDEDVPVLDLYNRYRGRQELFADESHFTDLGHRLAAQFIFENIKPLVH